MRITGLRVDGFGTLRETGVDGLAPGLTLVHGANGAGKSSLHAFVVRVLFGIPRSNAVDVVRHFEPLHGGRHGGALELVDEDGQPWTVTRVKGGNPTLHVLGPHGESTARDALAPLLGQLDRERFEQLFAIDLRRLVGTEDLPGEQLQRLLFDAATLGTAGSLRGARDLAAQRADALYLPSGRVQPVAEVRRDRNELAQQLREARTEVARLSDLREQVARADAERVELADEVERLDRELAVLRAAAEAWERHREARGLRRQVAQLDGPEVPEDLRARVAAARSARDAAAARREELQQRRTELRRRREALALDDALAAAAAELERLRAGVVLHVEREERLATARERARAAADAARDKCARIGSGWDSAQVRTVAVDGTAADRLRDAARAAEQRAGERDELSRRVREAEVRAERLATEVETAGAGADEGRDEGWDVGALARAEAVALLRSRVPVLDLADAAGATGHRRGGAGPPGTDGDRRGRFAVAGLLLVLGVAGLVGAVVTGEVLVAGVGALLLAAGAFWLARALGDRTTAAPSASVRQHGPDAQEVERARRDVAAAAAVLGLPERPGPAELARAEARLREDEASAAEQRRRRSELDEVQGELADLRSAHAAAEDRADRASAALAAVCAQLGLAHDATTGLAPGSLVDLHARVRDAGVALDDQDREQADVERLRTLVDAFAADARAAANAAGRDGLDGPAAVRALEALAGAAVDDRAARDEHTRLGVELGRVEGLLDDQQAALDAAADELADVHEQLGASDAGGLDALVAAHDERARLLAHAEALEGQVELLLGADAARGRQLLAEGDVAGWDARVRRLQEQRTELATRREGLLAERTRVESRLEELGGDATIPDLDQRIAMADEELADLVRRWAELALARDLLGAAVDHFEAQQQPVVLEEASRLLARFTRDAWVEVRQVDQLLYAGRPGAGVPVPAEQLSTGEQAQLYLALRVALAAQRGPTLPLLLDDLLGSADDERADAVLVALAELAQQRQVLLFTPSARTVARARTLLADVGVLELADGRVVAADPGTPT